MADSVHSISRPDVCVLYQRLSNHQSSPWKLWVSTATAVGEAHRSAKPTAFCKHVKDAGRRQREIRPSGQHQNIPCPTLRSAGSANRDVKPCRAAATTVPETVI